VIVAQLTDTHVVRDGTTYHGIETTRYLEDAIAALHALDPVPDLVLVTGDLVQHGHGDEYVRFARAMATLRIPYYVVPGNHDHRDRMRAVLPRETYGESTGARIRFALEGHAVRIIGLDATAPRRWPGAALDGASLRWFEETLARDPGRPAIVCVHQPPFRTGLHYLDAFGFVGGRRFRRAVERHPSGVLVLSGHIHCVRTARIGTKLALSGPSTAPMTVPELLERRPVGLRHEAPGFALHTWNDTAGFATAIHRRDDAGRYAAAGPPITAAKHR